MRLPVIIINDCWEYIIELELERNHGIHGRLVQGTQLKVPIRLLSLQVRLYTYSIATQPADYNDYLYPQAVMQ